MATVRTWLDLSTATSPQQRAVYELANLSARWFRLSGSSVRWPFHPADLSPLGDSSKAGLLMAAVELREALAKASDGREALRNLGFEPVAENVERE